MNNKFSAGSLKALCKLTVIAALFCAFSLQALAQTSAGTNINNQATATYSDGTTGYNAVSNQVTTTVAKVSGIAVTPDNGTAVSVVAGQQNVPFAFTVTNTGNFTDTFNLTNAAAYVSSTLGTVASVTYTSPTVTTATAVGSTNTAISLNQGQSATVTVYVNVSTTAAAASSFVVYLGDVGTSAASPYDNLAYAASSGRDVYTTATSAVNGQREARGDINATVANDAIPQVTLTASPTNISVGNDITFTASNCNVGARDLTSPYLVIPLPNQSATDTTPETTFAGFTGTNASTYNSTRQYSTDGTTWSAAGAALPASGVRLIRVPLITSPLTPTSTCESIDFKVSVPSTYDATSPISLIVELTGKNSLNSNVSDYSGAGATGTATVVTVTKTGAVAIGPDNNPEAGATTDLTEKTITVTTPVAPGTTVTENPAAVSFINELKNLGNATDTFTVTATPPSGTATVEYCSTANTQNCTTWVTAAPSVPKGGTLEVRVTVDLPANTNSGIQNTTVTATSGNTTTATDTTVDRLLLGGFINMAKTWKCFASDGTTEITNTANCTVGNIIEYTIAFSNISSTLTASSLVITENGSTAPNNWATYTSANGTPSVTNGTGVTPTSPATALSTTYNAGNTTLTTGPMSVAPGGNGTLKFRRTIN